MITNRTTRSTSTVRAWAVSACLFVGLVLAGCSAGSESPAASRRATSISTGFSFSCLTLSDGSAWCWGTGAEIPRDPFSGAPKVKNLEPFRFDAPVSFTSVDVGDDFACAVAVDRTVWCWGSNESGQLGVDDVATESWVPVQVRGLAEVVTVDVDASACAIVANGDVLCWGRGTPEGSSAVKDSTPTRIDGIRAATQVSAGGKGGCAVVEDGSVRCWGRTSAHPGGTTTASAINGLERIRSVSVGLWHTCAVEEGGRVLCWGADSEHGRLGDGDVVATDRSQPRAVVDIVDAVSVSVSEGHSCALLRSGSLACWGYNKRGQIGNGTATSALRPFVLQASPSFASVDTGTGSTCALLADGTPLCWGQYLGIFGDPEPIARPVKVRI